MPTTPDLCANHALNQSMCPCANTDCANHGICCECLRAHVGYGSPTACMNGRPRPVEILAVRPNSRCETNGERNLEWCSCGNSECSSRGVCCNCVRTHWRPDGNGRVACMKRVSPVKA